MAVPVEFSTIKNQADGAFRAGDFESAAAAYTQALEVLQSFKGDGAASVEADRLRIHSNRSLTFQKLQKWTEALDDAKKAVELDPKRSKSWFRIGQTLVGLDLFAEAVIAYDTGCKLDPRYADLRQTSLTWAGWTVMCSVHAPEHDFDSMHVWYRSDELNDALDDAKAKNKALPSKKNGA